MELCFFQLILSAFYTFVYVLTVIYCLIINKCKFNKRTKVVLIVLSMAMSLQAASSVLTYIKNQKEEFCGVYPITYTMICQQHIIIMIIYSFLVCRMLSIYYKMALATQPVPTCKARWARRLSNIQNSMIITYATCFTTFIWAFYIIILLNTDDDRLNKSQ